MLAHKGSVMVFLYIYYFARIFSAREFLGDRRFSEAQEVVKIEYYCSLFVNPSFIY